MPTASDAYDKAANSKTAREAGDAVRSAGDSVSDYAAHASQRAGSAAKAAGEGARDFAKQAQERAGDFASDVSRRAGKQFGRAQDLAAEAYEEAHEASKQYPHATVALALGLGFLLGVVATSARR